MASGTRDGRRRPVRPVVRGGPEALAGARGNYLRGGVGAARGLAQGDDAPGAALDAGLGVAVLPAGVLDLLLPQVALAAQRAGAADGVAPAGPGVGGEEGARREQPGGRERDDADDEQG